MARLWLTVGVLVLGCGGNGGGTPDPDAPKAVDSAPLDVLGDSPGFCPPNLVSSWSGDGVFTDSTGANPGTQVGTVGFAAATVGQGFAMTANNFVQVADSTSLDLTTAITIEGWVNLTSANLTNRIVQKTEVGGDGYLMDILVDASSNLVLRLIVLAVGGGHILNQTIGTVPTNTLIHVAGTYDGVSMNLYIDGVQVATRANTTGAITTNDRGLEIGAAEGGAAGFGGTLDEIGIFSRALTATEIAAIHTAGAAGRCR